MIRLTLLVALLISSTVAGTAQARSKTRAKPVDATSTDDTTDPFDDAAPAPPPEGLQNLLSDDPFSASAEGPAGGLQAAEGSAADAAFTGRDPTETTADLETEIQKTAPKVGAKATPAKRRDAEVAPQTVAAPPAGHAKLAPSKYAAVAGRPLPATPPAAHGDAGTIGLAATDAGAAAGAAPAAAASGGSAANAGGARGDGGWAVSGGDAGAPSFAAGTGGGSAAPGGDAGAPSFAAGNGGGWAAPGGDAGAPSFAAGNGGGWAAPGGDGGVPSFAAAPSDAPAKVDWAPSGKGQRRAATTGDLALTDPPAAASAGSVADQAPAADVNRGRASPAADQGAVAASAASANAAGDATADAGSGDEPPHRAGHGKQAVASAGSATGQAPAAGAGRRRSSAAAAAQQGTDGTVPTVADAAGDSAVDALWGDVPPDHMDDGRHVNTARDGRDAANAAALFGDLGGRGQGDGGTAERGAEPSVDFAALMASTTGDGGGAAMHRQGAGATGLKVPTAGDAPRRGAAMDRQDARANRIARATAGDAPSSAIAAGRQDAGADRIARATADDAPSSATPEDRQDAGANRIARATADDAPSSAAAADRQDAGANRIARATADDAPSGAAAADRQDARAARTARATANEPPKIGGGTSRRDIHATRTARATADDVPASDAVTAGNDALTTRIVRAAADETPSGGAVTDRRDTRATRLARATADDTSGSGDTAVRDDTPHANAATVYSSAHPTAAARQDGDPLDEGATDQPHAAGVTLAAAHTRKGRPAPATDADDRSVASTMPEAEAADTSASATAAWLFATAALGLVGSGVVFWRRYRYG